MAWCVILNLTCYSWHHQRKKLTIQFQSLIYGQLITSISKKKKTLCTKMDICLREQHDQLWIYHFFIYDTKKRRHIPFIYEHRQQTAAHQELAAAAAAAL
jgi:hypothetical protein